MADVPKLVEELWSLTLLEAIELAEILKKKWRPPEVSLADIKRYLPHWPDAVIERAAVLPRKPQRWRYGLAAAGAARQSRMGSHPWIQAPFMVARG